MEGQSSAALAFEVGEGQAQAVAGVLRWAGFGSIEARRDLAGIERVVVGTTMSAATEIVRIEPRGCGYSSRGV